MHASEDREENAEPHEGGSDESEFGELGIITSLVWLASFSVSKLGHVQVEVLFSTGGTRRALADPLVILGGPWDWGAETSDNVNAGPANDHDVVEGNDVRGHNGSNTNS